jgi:hypothetical protein
MRMIVPVDGKENADDDDSEDSEDNDRQLKLPGESDKPLDISEIALKRFNI